MKKHYYHIATFGCQMNKNDSERMESILQDMGLLPTSDESEADVVLLNSCSVRESAEARIYSKTNNISKLKKKKPNLIVGVTGCMPGRDKDGKIKGRLKEVDLFFKNEDMVNLPKWLCGLNPDFNDIETEDVYLKIKPIYKSKFQAFVPIQTGCNHFCTYCAVPYARGTEVNRPLKDILDEIKNLAKEGCKEVTLLGEIVNHYTAKDSEYFSKDNKYIKSDFAKLLWEINRIDGIERIHWTGPHPIYMDDEVIDALTLPKQVNFLHLPVQSGSTKILEKMNRRHDREFFIDLIKRIKAKKPDITIGTDLIVGFCGETRTDFEETLDMYRQCDFDIAYPAKYSTRSGTVAAKNFIDDVDQDEKKRRWFAVQNLMEEITYKKNQEHVDKKVSVLVEKFEDGWCEGHSSEMKLTRFKGSKDMVGTIQTPEIYKADIWLLLGRMV
jgi:tRNA-2-methylthio-N6-dimethylallyladenosine synthase